MGYVTKFAIIFIILVVPFLSRSSAAGPTRYEEVVVNSPVLVAAERFVANGDGTVTDTRRQLMWQQGDNGEQVAFEEAQKYCKNLRLGGYADWRLPEPDERDTAVAMELMMSRHARDVHAYFDLYWSSDRTTLLPFNYRPSSGREIQRAYPARGNDKAFVRAVRSVRAGKS